MTCSDAAQAHIVQGALANEQIASMLQNENFSSLYPTHVSATSGVDVLVYEKDKEAALQLLEENGMIGDDLSYCPRCGSAHIRLVHKRGKQLRAWIAAFCALMAASPLGKNCAYWEFICDECKERFESPVGKKKSREGV
jgi:hypothetical protein